MFLAPIGYLNAPRSVGKSLVHDPERGPLIRRAFESYATGRFTKEQLLKQVRSWGLTNRRDKALTSQAIGVLLRDGASDGPADLSAYGEVLESDDDRVLIKVARTEAPEVATRLLRDLPVADLTIEDPPIDDVIESVFATGRPSDADPAPAASPTS